jgi:hypothetical protein
MLHNVAPVRTEVSEERSASIIRVTRIGELGTTIAITSNQNTTACECQLLVTATEPQGITSQKTAFVMVTAVKTSNLTLKSSVYILFQFC